MLSRSSDKALITELLADKSRLIQENQKLKEQLTSLLDTIKKFSEGLKQMQEQPRMVRPKIPIPEYYRNEIDWQRAGMTQPEPEDMLQARRK